MMAFSAAVIPANALISSNSLSIAGSSTVYPIAVQAAQTFPAYWNGLVAANPSWSASALTASTPINIAGLGSGTAFKTVIPASGSPTADIGEMSRPPSDAEWTQNLATPGVNSASTAHIWAVGVDSLAIVYSPDMTWAPTQLTNLQAAKLFMSTDAAGNSPQYTTWGQFLLDYYGSTSNMTTAQQAIVAGGATYSINRAVRDPTSGTYDCFNNFFGKTQTSITGSNGAEIVDSTGAITGSQYMAPYIFCTANQDIYNALQTHTNCIGFISMGYLLKLGNMIGISIYNSNPPTQPHVGAYFAPTQANVINGDYTAFRWLWEMTPNTIPSTGANLVEGVWIAYMKLDANVVGSNPDFVTANDYMAMPRAAMAGGPVLDSNLASITPAAGQTQIVPRLVVDSNDFFYFMDAYIAYYGSHIYNPYADINAQGTINGNSFLGFMSAYVYYYTTYAPTH